MSIAAAREAASEEPAGRVLSVFTELAPPAAEGARRCFTCWASGTPVTSVINYYAATAAGAAPALIPAREKRTPRQFECTRLITVDHVKAVIARVPGFGDIRPTEEKLSK